MLLKNCHLSFEMSSKHLKIIYRTNLGLDLFRKIRKKNELENLENTVSFLSIEQKDENEICYDLIQMAGNNLNF